MALSNIPAFDPEMAHPCTKIGEEPPPPRVKHPLHNENRQQGALLNYLFVTNTYDIVTMLHYN